jgi:hypothetical protein
MAMRAANPLPAETYVFKAFNSIPVELMRRPDGSSISGQRLTAMFAGGPRGADVAEIIVRDVGFIPVHVGGIRCGPGWCAVIYKLR